jgi:hypothetical protein
MFPSNVASLRKNMRWFLYGEEGFKMNLYESTPTSSVAITP